MTDDDRPAFAQAMTLLSETLNEAMSPARIEGYWLALEDLSLEELRTAVHRALREQTEFFPKPGKLREYARPKKESILNVAMYQPYRPEIEERPALEAPVDMGALAAGIVKQLEAKVAENRAAEEKKAAMTPDEVAARKVQLREQAKRLLMDEPEGSV